MRKIKIKKYRKFKVIFGLSLLCAISMYGGHLFNKFVEPQLLALAKQHVTYVVNDIVKEVLKDMDFKQSEIIQINQGSDGLISSIQYDSAKLNEILYSALNTIDETLHAAQEGKAATLNKNVYFEDGVLYEVPIGYFTHMYFLYDKGPDVKVHMKMMNDITGNIKTEMEPYGINSTLIKINLEMKVQAEVLTFLHTTKLSDICEVPIVLQIVNGKVPNISPYELD